MTTVDTIGTVIGYLLMVAGISALLYIMFWQPKDRFK